MHIADMFAQENIHSDVGKVLTFLSLLSSTSDSQALSERVGDLGMSPVTLVKLFSSISRLEVQINVPSASSVSPSIPLPLSSPLSSIFAYF